MEEEEDGPETYPLVDPRDLEEEEEEVIYPGGITQDELDLATYMAMKGKRSNKKTQ